MKNRRVDDSGRARSVGPSAWWRWPGLRAALLLALIPPAPARADVWPPFAEVPFREQVAPAGEASRVPFLHATRQRLYMTWMETPPGATPALRLAWNDGTAWSAPRTVVADSMLMVNWADNPRLLVLSDSTLVVSYLLRPGRDPEAYDIRVVTSRDDGASWSAPLQPHRDKARAEHGFVSLVPDPVEGFWAVWLDGRNHAGGGSKGHGAGIGAKSRSSGGPATELRAARWRGGAFGPETRLDARVCDCCPTSAVRTLEGVAVAYRDRGDREMRDISVVRYERGLWGEPFQVRRDGWQIDGCPVNGPAMAARDRLLALAWFTDANENAEVFVALSDSSAFGLSRVVKVDDGKPFGRLAVEWLPDDAAVVVWNEEVSGGAEIRARRVTMDGEASPSRALVPTSQNRATGFPQLAIFNDRLWLAWTEMTDQGGRVRLGCLDPTQHGKP